MAAADAFALAARLETPGPAGEVREQAMEYLAAKTLAEVADGFLTQAEQELATPDDVKRAKERAAKAHQLGNDMGHAYDKVK